MFKFFKKEGFGKKILSLFQRKVDEEAIEELEKLFFEADLGPEISSDLSEKVRKLFRKNPHLTSEEILKEIQKELLSSMMNIFPSKKESTPQVILIVGVNGNGKTTSVAKLAFHYKQEGKKVLIAAADTFRAAAIDQLEIWVEKVGIEIVKGKQNGDAASVVFDGIKAALSRNVDIVIVDTAGRLHTRHDLLKELEKIYKVAGKALPGAPHETYLVLDATTGQNGIQQALTFHQFTPLTGLILTKMDGTAKGGIALAIQNRLKLPITYLGTGEKMEDLTPFEPSSYITALFEN